MLFGDNKINHNTKKIGFKISDEDKNTLFEKTDTKAGLLANYIVMFFIFFSIILVFLDTVQSINIKYASEIFYADFIISVFFLFEYIYRFIHSSHKIKFIFRFLNILDLLSFLPFFILVIFYGAGHYAMFAIFRIFRIFRIFELIERIPIVRKLIKGINTHKIEYLAAIFFIFLLLIIFSSIVYFAEFLGGGKETFSSLPASLWWGVVTMTTVGYGDMVPVTLLGRIFGGILMFLGPVLISILSSITILIFLNSTKLVDFRKREKICHKCGTKNDNKARYCDYCGEKLKK